MGAQFDQVSIVGGFNNMSVIHQSELRNVVWYEIAAVEEVEEYKDHFSLRPGVRFGGCFLNEEKQSLDLPTKNTRCIECAYFEEDFCGRAQTVSHVGWAYAIRAQGYMFVGVQSSARARHFGKIVSKGGGKIFVHLDFWIDRSQSA